MAEENNGIEYFEEAMNRVNSDKQEHPEFIKLLDKYETIISALRDYRFEQVLEVIRAANNTRLDSAMLDGLNKTVAEMKGTHEAMRKEREILVKENSTLRKELSREATNKTRIRIDKDQIKKNLEEKIKAQSEELEQLKQKAPSADPELAEAKMYVFKQIIQLVFKDSNFSERVKAVQEWPDVQKIAEEELQKKYVLRREHDALQAQAKSHVVPAIPVSKELKQLRLVYAAIEDLLPSQDYQELKALIADAGSIENEKDLVKHTVAAYISEKLCKQDPALMKEFEQVFLGIISKEAYAKAMAVEGGAKEKCAKLSEYLSRAYSLKAQKFRQSLEKQHTQVLSQKVDEIKKAQTSQTTSELVGLRHQVKSLQGELDRAKAGSAQAEEYKSQISALNGKISQLSAQLSDAQSSLTSAGKMSERAGMLEKKYNEDMLALWKTIPREVEAEGLGQLAKVFSNGLPKKGMTDEISFESVKNALENLLAQRLSYKNQVEELLGKLSQKNQEIQKAGQALQQKASENVQLTEKYSSNLKSLESAVAVEKSKLEASSSDKAALQKQLENSNAVQQQHAARLEQLEGVGKKYADEQAAHAATSQELRREQTNIKRLQNMYDKATEDVAELQHQLRSLKYADKLREYHTSFMETVRTYPMLVGQLSQVASGLGKNRCDMSDPEKTQDLTESMDWLLVHIVDVLPKVHDWDRREALLVGAEEISRRNLLNIISAVKDALPADKRKELDDRIKQAEAAEAKIKEAEKAQSRGEKVDKSKLENPESLGKIVSEFVPSIYKPYQDSESNVIEALFGPQKLKEYQLIKGTQARAAWAKNKIAELERSYKNSATKQVAEAQSAARTANTEKDKAVRDLSSYQSTSRQQLLRIWRAIPRDVDAVAANGKFEKAWHEEQGPKGATEDVSFDVIYSAVEKTVRQRVDYKNKAEAASKKASDLEDQLKGANQQVLSAKNDAAAELKRLSEANKQLDEKLAQQAAALKAQEEKISSMSAGSETYSAGIAEANAAIAERDQKITQLQADIEEMKKFKYTDFVDKKLYDEAIAKKKEEIEALMKISEGHVSNETLAAKLQEKENELKGKYDPIIAQKDAALAGQAAEHAQLKEHASKLTGDLAKLAEEQGHAKVMAGVYDSLFKKVLGDEVYAKLSEISDPAQKQAFIESISSRLVTKEQYDELKDKISWAEDKMAELVKKYRAAKKSAQKP